MYTTTIYDEAYEFIIDNNEKEDVCMHKQEHTDTYT